MFCFLFVLRYFFLLFILFFAVLCLLFRFIPKSHDTSAKWWLGQKMQKPWPTWRIFSTKDHPGPFNCLILPSRWCQGKPQRIQDGRFRAEDAETDAQNEMRARPPNPNRLIHKKSRQCTYQWGRLYIIYQSGHCARRSACSKFLALITYLSIYPFPYIIIYLNLFIIYISIYPSIKVSN